MIGSNLHCLTITVVTTLPPTRGGLEKQNWGGEARGGLRRLGRTQRWVVLGSRGGSSMGGRPGGKFWKGDGGTQAPGWVSGPVRHPEADSTGWDRVGALAQGGDGAGHRPCEGGSCRHHSGQFVASRDGPGGTLTSERPCRKRACEGTGRRSPRERRSKNLLVRRAEHRAFLGDTRGIKEITF